MTTIGALCARYLQDYPRTAGTKRAALIRLQDESIGKVKAPGTAQHFIDYGRERRETVAPCTVLNDIIHVRGVLAHAKPSWGLQEVTDAPIREAWPVMRKQGLIGTAKRRTRIPVGDELARVSVRRGKTALPMHDIVPFQFHSTRRISETTRLEWPDLDEQTKTILVRDMKHPTRKAGNHKRVALPDPAFEIIMRQPRKTTRIFPYLAKSIEKAFQRSVAAEKIEDLHLHDLRRGGITFLFEQGYPVEYVMLVSGHDDPTMPLTVYNGLKAEDFHKRRPT